MNEGDLFRASLERGDSCIPPADLETFAGGEGSPQAIEHVRGCAYCRGEVEALRAFMDATPSTEELADIRRIEHNLIAKPAWKGEPGSAGWWTFLARPWAGVATAGLAAALAVAVYVNQPQPLVPTPDAPDVVRSIQVDGVSPIGDLAEPPSAVRWSAVPGAVRYLVSMEEVDGTSIWSHSASSAELALPQEARRLVTDRKTLRWVVAAEDSQGRRIAVSAPQPFRFVRGLK